MIQNQAGAGLAPLGNFYKKLPKGYRLNTSQEQRATPTY